MPIRQRTSTQADASPPIPETKPSIGTFSLDDILKKSKSSTQSPPPIMEVQSTPVESVTPEQSFSGDMGTPSLFSGDMGTPENAVETSTQALPDPFGASTPPPQTFPVQSPLPQPSNPFGVTEQTAMAPPIAQAPQGNIQAVVVVPFGVVIPRYPINKFKASEGRVNRVALPFINKGVVVTRYHYEKDIGYFYCFSGQCCQKSGLPPIRYEVPLLVYDTDQTGKPVSAKFSFFFLQMAEEDYSNLCVLGQNLDVSKCDFLLTCSDEHYQKVKLQNVGPALWCAATSPIIKEVQDIYDDTWKYVPQVVARNMSVEEYLEASSEGQVISQPQQAGITDLKQFIKK